MPKIDKTMTPKGHVRCRVCKGAKELKVTIKGVEKIKPCPACGGTGDGKMSQK